MGTINYPSHTVRVSNKYSCTCGKKFTRKTSDWYTMSPFNTMTHKENVEKIKKQLSLVEKTCPECKKMCPPVTK